MNIVGTRSAFRSVQRVVEGSAFPVRSYFNRIRGFFFRQLQRIRMIIRIGYRRVGRARYTHLN